VFIIDSDIHNVVILYLGTKRDDPKNILDGLVQDIKYFDNLEDVNRFYLNNLNKYDAMIFINAIVYKKDFDYEAYFQDLYIVNSNIPLLLIVPESRKIIKNIINFSIDNFILSPLEKDVLIDKLNKIAKKVAQKKELDTLNAQMYELNNNLEKRVKEEVEKNDESMKLLLQQSRLAAMGEMIANIAHQWRQPLMATGSTIDSILLKSRLGKLNHEVVEEKVKETKDLLKYMSTTIDNFKSFFKTKKETKAFLVYDSVDATISFIKDMLIQNSIEIVFSNNIKDNTVNGDPVELSQALLNIFTNSKDILLKLEDGIQKYIFIDIEITCIDNSDIELSTRAIKLVIKDNGGGIRDDIKDKIFEPYTTTKHDSIGTGIGLYMTSQAINNMGGKISAKNVTFSYEDKSYRGAQFDIILPC
jgi:two-component system C4-dicarboxylate transport sensor histidine kinase DctB